MLLADMRATEWKPGVAIAILGGSRRTKVGQSMTLVLQQLPVSFDARSKPAPERVDIAGWSIIGLFGHSGSGKTTYLRKLAAMLGGHSCFHLFQSDACMDTLTGRQNLELGLLFGSAGVPADRSATVGRLIELLELEPILDRPATTLSGGERRRILLAMSVLTELPVLLLDEPFVGIGWKYESRAEELLRVRDNTGQKTVIVSHDLDLLCSLCDGVLIFDDHRILESFPTESGLPNSLRRTTAGIIGVHNFVPSDKLRALARPPLCDKFPLGIAFWRGQAFAVPGGELLAQPPSTDLVLVAPRSNVLSVAKTVLSGDRYANIRLGPGDPLRITVLDQLGKGDAGEIDLNIIVRDFIEISE